MIKHYFFYACLFVAPSWVFVKILTIILTDFTKCVNHNNLLIFSMISMLTNICLQCLLIPTMA